MAKEVQNPKTYTTRLNKLTKQAESDKKYFISNFFQKMINTYSFNAEIYDYICKTADDLTEELVKAYEVLFEKKASLEWFQCMGEINDERSCPEQYFLIVQGCWDSEVSITQVQEALSISGSPQEFEALIMRQENEVDDERENAPQNYLEFLLKENEAKSARISFLLAENGAVRQELKNLQENSFRYRYEFQRGKQELEQIKKENTRAVLTEKMLVKKIDSLQVIKSELENRVEFYLKENENLLQEKNSLYEELELVKSRLTEYEQVVKEKEAEIEKLSESLDSCTFFNDESSFIEIEDEDLLHEQEYSISEFEEPEEDDLEGYSVGNNIFENIINIEDKKESVVKHTNLFTTIISKYYEKRFEKKTVSEQENLIFIKMMEHNFSKEMVQIVRNAMRTNTSIARVDLYRLVSKKVTKEELLEFCGSVA